ncbi:hypothetical protein [Sinorhizobium meliloti]|uniref:hypothetical protein n=1 Tax=Rhizobium meliloti TaxID=382 RepID=UPI00299E402C|nr:hypothetical protein [Sinorhizobium meliloti]
MLDLLQELGSLSPQALATIAALAGAIGAIIAAVITAIISKLIVTPFLGARDRQDKETEWRKHAIELTKLDLERKLKTRSPTDTNPIRPSILDFLANYRDLQELGDKSPKALYAKIKSDRVRAPNAVPPRGASETGGSGVEVSTPSSSQSNRVRREQSERVSADPLSDDQAASSARKLAKDVRPDPNEKTTAEGGRKPTEMKSSQAVRIMSEKELSQVLSEEIGPLASDLLLIPQEGAEVSRLPFDWVKAREYYSEYCPRGGGNDCPDGEFALDCTHFVGHGLSKSKIIVNLPSATCTNGVCIRVAELAAAFKNSVAKYSNVKKISDLKETREGDFCFVTSWFGLSKDHVMVLAGTIYQSGGRVWGHTNPRCAEQVDLTGESLAVYRIE